MAARAAGSGATALGTIMRLKFESVNDIPLTIGDGKILRELFTAWKMVDQWWSLVFIHYKIIK
jgi:hypothetical protein